MAFVYQNMKTISNKNENPGPGSYNINDKSPKTNKKSNFIIPFGSDSIRNHVPKAKLVELENSPGPGSYYKDQLEIKLKKISEKKQDPLSVPLHKLIESNSSFESNKIFPLGFSTSEKRFQVDLKDALLPGPGQYSLINNENSKKNKNKEINKLRSSLSLSPNKSLNVVSSIPSKLQSFGYEILKDGKIKPSQDPLSNRKYNGTKYNSVGPGEYKINKDSDWLNKGTSWAKSRVNKFNYKENNLSSDSIDVISTQSQSHISPLEINTSQIKPIKRLNNAQKEILIKNYKARKIISKELKEDKEITQLEKIINSNDTPGPGYYHNPNNTAFIKRIVPEQFQSFGSASVRFSNNKISNSIGPGYYYREDLNYENKKLKEELNKQKSLLKHSPNPKIVKPVSFGSLLNNNTEKRLENSPGPGSYNINPQYVKKSIGVSKAIFGTSEKKFSKLDTIETSIDNLGPGSYLQLNQWNKLDDKNIIDKIMSPKRYKKPIPKSKERSIRIEENKENLPPIGIYDVGRYNSIENNLVKNVAKIGLINAPFSSLSQRFKYDKDLLKQENNLGPGYYYKYNKNKVKENLNSFNSSENRFIYSKDSNNNVGPGLYNKESYFDWNKKSFNLKFI